MHMHKNSIYFDNVKSNYKINFANVPDLPLPARNDHLDKLQSDPNYLTWENLIEDNFYIMPALHIKQNCSDTPADTPADTSDCQSISPVINKKYYRYDTYTSSKYILPVPIYAQRSVFFYLWEIFQKYDLNFKFGGPLNLLVISDIPTYFENNSKIIPLPDIMYCIQENRKRHATGTINDHNDMIYITNTDKEIDQTYFKTMFANASVTKINSEGKISPEKTYDLIICWTNKIDIIYSSLSFMNIGGNLIFYLDLDSHLIDPYANIMYSLAHIFKKVNCYVPECLESKRFMMIIVCQKLMIQNLIQDGSDPIPPNIQNRIYRFVDDLDRIVLNAIGKIKELPELFGAMDSKHSQLHLYHVRNQQISFAEKWCRKFNVQIHPFYSMKEKEPVLSDKSINFAKIFPPAEGVDRNKLMMTDIGLYSITPYAEADSMVDLIAKHVAKPLDKLIITESNGGLGGNTIAFAKKFFQVNTAEYSNLHCDILRNNIGIYGFDNVQIYCTSYLYVFENIQQDILFMDPAWSGPGYKYVSKLYLYIGEYMIEDIINWIRSKVRVVVIKAPFNYDIDYFKKKVQHKKLVIHKIRNYQLLIADL